MDTLELKGEKTTSRRRFLVDTSKLAGSVAIFGIARGTPVLDSRPRPEETLSATITIDSTPPSHSISANIYGSFTEHIGRCIYGGVYEEGSSLSDENGFRKDVMAAARDWGLPILRWPGGNFASNYHWLDGVGPKSARPRRYNVAWFEEESNHFGTDEFVTYCRKINAEPYVCVNLGTGTIDEAANWVEYCNGTGDTSYANLRRKNGFANPHNIKYWGLGNEMYGAWQIGAKSAEDYAKLARECAKIMKWVDPTIKLVACGSEEPAWNRVVLENLVNLVDYISLHDYEGTDDYYELLGSVKRVETLIHRTAAVIEETDHLRGKSDAILALSLPEIKDKKRVEIACDEWNIWYRKWNIWRRDIPNPVEETYNLRDALWTASVLNLFQRLGNVVTMANLAQLVNSIAPIFTSKDGLFLQPIYFPMQLYRRECGSQFLTSTVECPTFSSKSYKDVPYLDVSATTNPETKQVTVAVVNRHETSPIATKLESKRGAIASVAAAYEINGDTPSTENSFVAPHNVGISAKQVEGSGSGLDYSFPAHSITVLKLNMS
jgi:alpha-L-arabinofuranosidase